MTFDPVATGVAIAFLLFGAAVLIHRTSVLRIRARLREGVLRVLGEHGPLSEAALLELARQDFAALVFVLWQMKTEGLVEVERRSRAERIGAGAERLWSLTEAGRRMVRR